MLELHSRQLTPWAQFCKVLALRRVASRSEQKKLLPGPELLESFWILDDTWKQHSQHNTTSILSDFWVVIIFIVNETAASIAADKIVFRANFSPSVSFQVFQIRLETSPPDPITRSSSIIAPPFASWYSVIFSAVSNDLSNNIQEYPLIFSGIHTFLQSYFLFSIVPFFSIFFSNRS